MSEEEAYKEFFENFSKTNKKEEEPFLPAKKVEKVENTFIPTTSANKINVRPNVINNFNNDKTRYEEIVIEQLPLGFMYPTNTKIYLRGCYVKEIQDFSTYDRNNPFSFKNKLNDIIESCIIFESSDGTLKSYLELMDGDRVWLIYTIREKTFPKGKVLTVPVNYIDNDNKKQTDNIEILRKNLEIWQNQEIMDFFDNDKKCFVFNTTLRDEPYYIAPPSIGLRNCFDQYFEIKMKEGKDNIEKSSSFFKIAPYLKPNVHYMNYEEMVAFQLWFENDITPDEYSFLYDLSNNLLNKIGLRGLKKNIPTATIYSISLYPKRGEELFIIPNAYNLFIKQ